MCACTYVVCVCTCCGGVPAAGLAPWGPDPCGQRAFRALRQNVGPTGARLQVPLTSPLAKGSDACSSPVFCECREGTWGALGAVCGHVGAAGDRRVPPPTPPTPPPPQWLGTEAEAESPVSLALDQEGRGCSQNATSWPPTQPTQLPGCCPPPPDVPRRDRPHTTGLSLPSAHPTPELGGHPFLTPDLWLRAVPHWCSWSLGMRQGIHF